MSAPDPNCKICGGTGSVEEEAKPPHPPRFSRCQCVIRGDIQRNVSRILPGLWEAPKVPKSPLLGLQEEDVRITSGEEFLSHLRHVAMRQPLGWLCRVVSDAELTTAWLASIALQGKDILDADAYKVSTKALTIPDLVVPPDLLVIRMGVKQARNQAASECLAEALNIRAHQDKPTWVWDEPHHPLDVGHIFWSDVVGRILRSYKKFNTLSTPEIATTSKTKATRQASNPGTPNRGRKTLRGGKK